MAGDRDAQFEELYKYYPMVFKLLLTLGFEREDAHDLAQQVFLRVYEHMDSYRGEAKSSYLEKVTRRLAYNAMRDRHAAKREGISVPAEEILELADEEALAADVSLELKERHERLARAIEQLGLTDQTTIRMQLAGLSYQDMTRELGITLPALKSRLNVARKRLRDVLGEEPEGLGGGDDQ